MTHSRIVIPLFLLVILSLITVITAENVMEADIFTTEGQNTTAPGKAEDKMPLWAGFVGCIVASVFFGSNLLPVKQFSAGDGFFFQFVFCVAVWLVGLILNVILDNQRFYPLVLVGGILWTTGNLVTVFCIKTCGLAVGLLIWGTTSLIMGWAGGRFGIFGVKPQIPSIQALNYTSVVLAAISAIFFLFIKSTPTPTATEEKSNGDVFGDIQSSVEMKKIGETTSETGRVLDTDFPFLNRMSEKVQQILGCALAALAGLFYGLMFIPDQYIRDYPEKYLHDGRPPASNGLYYIHSQYSGILLSSLFYFVVYAALKRNRPGINPNVALPAMVSGVMWAVANIGFSVAISALGSSVAYPIVSVLPGIVTSLWSLFLFKEIQGKRNFIFLGIGMLVRILAAVCSGLSTA